jgi:NADH:ubiquinone oxidoreductase subunit E
LETQERFLATDNFANLDLTKDRVKRQIRFVKSDTQRHYMMFFSKIANEKRERIEYEKMKYELEGRIRKLIDLLDKIREKTEIIDGRPMANNRYVRQLSYRIFRLIRSIADHR